MAHQQETAFVLLCFQIRMQRASVLLGNLGRDRINQVTPINAAEFLVFRGMDAFLPYLHPDRAMGNLIRGDPHQTNITIYLVDGDMDFYGNLRDTAPQLQGVTISILPPPP